MIYCDGKKKDEKLQAISNAEQNYEKEFANFVKKMHKRKREASKDSNNSAADPNARDKSKEPQKKNIANIRLSSTDKKDDVKL